MSDTGSATVNATLVSSSSILSNIMTAPSAQRGLAGKVANSLAVCSLCVGLRAAARLLNKVQIFGWDDCNYLKTEKASRVKRTSGVVDI